MLSEVSAISGDGLNYLSELNFIRFKITDYKK
jgi:hypothetical protein